MPGGALSDARGYNLFMNLLAVAIQIDGPIIARNLAVSDDNIQWYPRNPFGEIANRVLNAEWIGGPQSLFDSQGMCV